jgi:large subunit ribosomal protein L25
MAEERNLNYLVTEARESFGKGAARKIRAVGKIPAVLYGHGTAPQHLTLPGHQVGLIIRKANQVLELEIDGKVQLALVKDVQRDPVRQIIEHLDLIVVRKGEKVQVEVSVHVIGEPTPGTVAELDTQRLLLEVSATNIPERIEVNIDGFEAGSRVVAGDVVLPEGATLVSDPEALVVAVAVPQEQDLGEVAEAEAPAEAAAAPDEAAE